MKRQASWVLTAFLLLVISACGNTEESAFLNKKTPLKAGEHISIEKTFYNENAICLENADSTKTLYLYSSPLYYQDDRKKEHVLIDNSLNANEDNDAFFNTFNDIQCFLPTSLSSEKPILLKKSYSEMKIYLQTKESKKGKKASATNLYGFTGEGILYKDICGGNAVNVLPDDFGINMEFLVSEYETTVLTYQIEMDNVELDTNCSDYVLFRDVKEKEVKGVLYLPVVMDCNEKIMDIIDNNACSMAVRKTAPGIFSVDIVLKKDFIETACYPLKVNGSIHLYKPKQPDSAIYSFSSEGYFLNDKVLLGNSKIKGEGQLLVRFEALDLLNLNAEDILSAEYILSEISNGEKEATIAMYPVLSEWCSLNTRWHNKPAYDIQNAYRITVDKSGDYSFDITGPLKNWIINKGKETDYIIRHGFVLVNETPDVPKLFATGDNGMFTSCLKIKLRKVEETN